MNRITIDDKEEIGYASELEGSSRERLLTVQDIGNLLNVPKSYVYQMTHKHEIPFMKIGGHVRFSPSAIDKWLQGLEVTDVGISERER